MTDKRVTKTACVTFLACEGTWRLAGHELKPNRDVRPRAHTTQHVHPCAPTKSASLPPCPYLTFVLPFTLHSAAMYPRTGCDTAEADAGQHRLIRSARSRPTDVTGRTEWSTIIMRDRAWPCRAPCSAFDDFPSTVGDRDDQTCLS